MRSVSAVPVIVILTSTIFGCTTSAARQTYRDDVGTKLTISGESAAGRVTIYVNGEPAVENESIYSDISGMYQGRKLTANCEMHTQLLGSEQECDIYIDGEYAANLYFR